MSVQSDAMLHSTTGSVAVIIVTFNSDRFLTRCLDQLEAQTRRPDRTIIVDSGSSDRKYLDTAHSYSFPCTVILKPNVGFCTANNIGWSLVKDFDYILYVNPDAFLTPHFIELSLSYMNFRDNADVGLLGGSLLRYDMEAQAPSGYVDSTGIFQTWYGRFFDRDQQKPNSVLQRYTSPVEVPALCAAAVFCRNTALHQVSVGGDIFDPSYFMYKDDIDLSWRVRRADWKLIYHPGLVAYHCRGWKKRSATSTDMRLLSARNEVKMFLKFRSPYLLYALAKYALVRSLGV
jgi:GT2 family glycosyltransferase